MATLEEVSDRLMKPAKDLADWNFPLATVLEEYYTLLNEQEDVNFSNAALVLQNSANVYVRRIEYLYHDVTVLDESFAEHEAQESAPKESKKGAKGKAALIDFGDFEPIDFTKFIGKNNNINARIGNKNAVKLLTQRFPQLENSRSSLPIEVYDIHGEVVGKKYDFRCNEYLNASGMLVEHLTPEDYLDPSTSQNSSIPTTIPCSDINLELSFNSIQEATATENGFSGVVTSQENCENSCVVQETDTCVLDSSFASSYDSGFGSSIQSSKIRPDSAFSNFADGHWDSPNSRPGSSLSNADEDSFVAENLSSLDNSEKNTENAEENHENRSQAEISTLEKMTNENLEKTGDVVGEEENRCTSESSEKNECPENLDFSQKSAEKKMSPRRSKRVKNVIDAVNNLNPNPWPPIPFDGMINELSTPRTELKEPSSKSLLKSKEKHRKRIVTPVKKKKRAIKRLSTTESDAIPSKMTMYSPTSQLFHPFKKEEMEDLQMCLEESFKNRPKLDVLHYEAVTDNSLDLLGYRGRDEKSNREKIAHIEPGFPANIPKSDLAISGIAVNVIESDENIESTDVDAAVDDFPMPDTPESSDSSSEISPATPTPTYQSRIEQSVRNICESVDVRTAEEEAVLRWHEYMEPRLREAERRPRFDIKEYGARVIEKIKSHNDGKIEFLEMVNNEKPTEVARYFLASLQLANKYNVHIDTTQNVEGNFTLAIFDKDR